MICAAENKKRDDAGIVEAFDNAYDDDLTDKKVKFPRPMIYYIEMLTPQQNLQFRYIL